MYTYIPPKPYNTKLVQSDREAFLDALAEMDNETQKSISDMVMRIATAIMEKQQMRFKNMNVAYNDAVFIVSRIIWKIGA